MIFNQTIDLIDSSYNHRLSDFNQGWLSPPCLKAFSDSVHKKGVALGNVWGFIDGSVRPCCKPKVKQRILYNGHKRLHVIKYQSVTTPSGMIANLFGLVEGKRHDCAILACQDFYKYYKGFLMFLKEKHYAFSEILHIS